MDRKALLDVIVEGHPRFFLGSDSAPHPIKSKIPKLAESYHVSGEGQKNGDGEDGPGPCAAGVYTSPILLPLVAYILEKAGALDKLEGYVSTNGRKFYGLPAKKEDGSVTLRRCGPEKRVPGYYKGKEDGVDAVAFMAGESLGWEIAQ